MIVKDCSVICSGKVYLSVVDRKQLGPASEVAVRRRNGQLIFYSKREWEDLRADIIHRGTEPRVFARIFLQKMDKRGRVQIPASLRKGTR